jgi:tRNA(Ile)-lysidine synthase
MALHEQLVQRWVTTGSIRPGQKVLLAVSGGIDSMVMAHLFFKAGIPFGIAHCNFGLRGEASDLDEQLVSERAAAYDAPFFTMRFDTKQKMAEWKKAVQETARILRYEWLDTVRTENQYTYLATAHHAGDNAETLLMNLFKGTGMAGLHAIPEQNGSIIRPMLFMAKEDIRSYAAAYDITWRDDASNDTDAYLRNAVRHHIIPAVEQWFPDAVSRIGESIQRFAQGEELYRKAVNAEIKKLAEPRGRDVYIPIRKLRHRRPLEAICYELFTPYGFSPAQVSQVMQLMDAESGRYIASATHRVLRNRDFLIVTDILPEAADMILVEAVPFELQAGRFRFHAKTGPRPDVIPSDPWVASIDMGRLEFPLVLRKWRKGDYFYPLGMGMKKKKISKFFIDQKVPLHQKEEIWVLESNKRIVWVAGMRMDERFKITANTSDVLTISVQAVV